MKYINILMNCASEPWALEKSKLIAVANFLRFKAAGGSYSAEELSRITQKREQEVRKSEGAIGVLPIQGVIGERMNLLDDISGGTSTEMISRQLRGMLNDDAIKVIVLDINSPGGVARSVEELAAEIFAARGIKPIVAQVNTCAASAAYWIAAQADEVVVTPSGQAGSIGVYTIHEDVSEMLAKEGIKETFIYSGQYKVIGNAFEPLGDEAKSIIQKRVDELAASFTRGVAQGRNTTIKDVSENFGQGLMFGAEELVGRGMADRIATMAETLERFGVYLNPALSRHRSRSETSKTFIAKLSAGDRLTVRELENGLKGLGLSNSEAERAARECFKGHAPGEPETKEADQAAVQDAFAELRRRLDGFSIP